MASIHDSTNDAHAAMLAMRLVVDAICAEQQAADRLAALGRDDPYPAHAVAFDTLMDAYNTRRQAVTRYLRKHPARSDAAQPTLGDTE